MNLMDKVLSIIFIQIFLFTSTSLVFGRRNNDTDKFSLLAFKSQILDDPLRVLSSWNESQHLCEWTGIKCGRRHQRVTRLDLPSYKLKGQLSPYIGNLSFLRVLNLHNNSFIHGIPQELGRLFRLQSLDLRNNSLNGQIPSNISHCSNLLRLRLAGNNFTGKLPQNFGSLSKLLIFDLQSNNLVGEIPSSLGNLSCLETMSLQRNNLYGSIPNSFGRLKSLKELYLGINSLNGTVLQSLFNLSQIKILSLSFNKLQGSLPSELGLTLPYLENLSVASNQLSGKIPNTISSASNLMVFQLGDNSFTGNVPSFKNQSNLRVLQLYYNHFGRGENSDLNFLSSLVNCTYLVSLEVSANNFGGQLPESIGNLSTNIRLMGISENWITGGIPAGIGNLVNLELLVLEKNRLTGPVPSSIGRLKSLQRMHFSQNKLSGVIPSSLGNITFLSLLDLSLNTLRGSIPSSLADCKNLLILDLSYNNLSGSIPKEIIGLSSLTQYLDLSRNHLSGFIPRDVGNLINIQSLDLSKNKLSGEIPETLGRCISLTGFSLAENFLQGAIPLSLASMKEIEQIYLFSNNLSGPIPTFFEDFHFLLYLNLSFNDFEGGVPVGRLFKNESAVSLVGNRRLCGGVPQLKLPKCPSNLNKKHKILSSLKFKISVGVVCVLFVMFLLVILYWSSKRRSKSIFAPPSGSSLLKVSYGDLLKATDGFSSENLVGEGSFGSVYKGILDHEERLVVAIKVLNLQLSRASKSFKAECKALKSVKHRNIVTLITACSSIDFQGNDFKALVYKFMVYGSLEEWLHPSNLVNLGEEQRHLNLIQRLNIAIDVANALDYLHNHCHNPTVHCDLKPSNVLLDHDMVAHVGDFGLARFLPDASHPSFSGHTSSVGIKGSIGYAAPEYGMGVEVSKRGDVYSYGILLLEIFTGKRPSDDVFKDGLNLNKFVSSALPELIEEILDPMLLVREVGSNNNSTQYRSWDQNQRTVECLVFVLNIGVACSAELPRDRMEISSAAAELCHVRDILLRTRRHRGQ